MRTLKRVITVLFSRLFLVGLMILTQLIILIAAIIYFSQNIFYVYLFCHLLSFLMALIVVNKDENPSYRITWLFAILSLPVIGGVFYIALGNRYMPKSLLERLHTTVVDISGYMPDDNSESLRVNEHQMLQARYIQNVTGCMLFDRTQSTYYPLGDDMFIDMVKELEKAEKYIFLEFFIIRPGIMWDKVFEILGQKVKDGIDVYLMYDDVGSITTLPKGYDKIIKASGIKLCVFNPFRPRVSSLQNYRDHRKLLIIDGKVGFCGGINLADEYINKLDRFGHWKDTGVMLKGAAVWEMVLLFLQQWRFGTGDKIDFNRFRTEGCHYPSDGLIQVFGDSPLDKFNTTETAYLNIISRATKYVYITSPYLVIDYEMEQALCTAAISGIDVRIITPFIYDKWYVHILTRSHYKKLIEAGVKIFEYTPGFIHSKMFVCDDNVSMVGTCNMDFRSFYLHFECSVAFYSSKIISDIKSDFLKCQDICHAITSEDASSTSVWIRIIRVVLKVFAPLM